jgi:small-conductance mechanosensitive channel
MMMRLARASIFVFAVLLLQPSFAADPRPSPEPPLHTAEIVAYLARTISWFRHVTALEQPMPTPVDVLSHDSAQRSATRTLQLAFDFARAAAPLVRTGQPDRSKAPSTDSPVDRAADRANARIATAERLIAEVDASLSKATSQSRPTLMARRNELQAELNFAKQIRDSVQGVRTLLSGQSTGGADLLGFVDRLERSVPEAARRPESQPPAATPPANSAAPVRPESAGIVGLIAETFGTERGKRQLDDVLAETEALKKNLEQLRAPLVSDLTNAVRRSDAAMNDSASQDARQMEADRQEIEALSARFKQVSAIMSPLREHGLQMDLARSSLLEQRNALQQRYSSAAGYLFFRALGLIVTIVVILAISELWRRGTFRYVRDPRRRKQFLLLRRVVVSCVIVAAVIIGLLNEFGSVATYAGFLTAGLAVALQNPIASVVAYFFLIGRYGLRVGDRVTIEGVSGDVLEIGLVRLYLMELTGEGADLHPTGRVVGFSNSVVFQPAAMFRQMPGTDYVWHTVTLTLAPDADLQLAESRLMAAVDAVYQPYRERVEQQYAALQRSVDVPLPSPKPAKRLRFTKDGLEFLVRYPVELRDAAATDDSVVNALSDAIAAEPRLALSGSGTPRVQPSI